MRHRPSLLLGAGLPCLCHRVWRAARTHMVFLRHSAESGLDRSLVAAPIGPGCDRFYGASTMDKLAHRDDRGAPEHDVAKGEGDRRQSRGEGAPSSNLSHANNVCVICIADVRACHVVSRFEARGSVDCVYLFLRVDCYQVVSVQAVWGPSIRLLWT